MLLNQAYSCLAYVLLSNECLFLGSSSRLPTDIPGPYFIWKPPPLLLSIWPEGPGAASLSALEGETFGILSLSSSNFTDFPDFASSFPLGGFAWPSGGFCADPLGYGGAADFGSPLTSSFLSFGSETLGALLSLPSLGTTAALAASCLASAGF